MKNFSLQELYVLMSYGLRTTVSNGQIEEISREEETDESGSVVCGGGELH